MKKIQELRISCAWMGMNIEIVIVCAEKARLIEDTLGNDDMWLPALLLGEVSTELCGMTGGLGK